MTTPPAAPAKKPKQKRQDCYQARATISIPISSDPQSYAKAVEAVDGLLAELPAGSRMEFVARGLGKIAAE